MAISNSQISFLLCSYRKCHSLVRDLPLKCKKIFIPPDGSPPPPKRVHLEHSFMPRPLQASPLKLKRFSLAPERKSKDKPDTPVVQIHWPASFWNSPGGWWGWWNRLIWC